MIVRVADWRARAVPYGRTSLAVPERHSAAAGRGEQRRGIEDLGHGQCLGWHAEDDDWLWPSVGVVSALEVDMDVAEGGLVRVEESLSPSVRTIPTGRRSGLDDPMNRR